jgi:hypothetical protein
MPDQTQIVSPGPDDQSVRAPSGEILWRDPAAAAGLVCWDTAGWPVQWETRRVYYYDLVEWLFNDRSCLGPFDLRAQTQIPRLLWYL